ncbi:hypothetical protein [Pandoraea terrigena]|uniref:Uncharacterized protein n=1 Tax=Pandoraea terrigena TaxID=2508292 RepID=A0A5E4X8F9_9BURK|nr:hypothetical protein [Pandoraea terrigena]VVE32528.1 hypothetical protein PTE31013_03751 [Pandoraea terrigena]
MPLNRLPKTVAWCLGLSSSEETSHVPSRRSPMARTMTSVANRAPHARVPPGGADTTNAADAAAHAPVAGPAARTASMRSMADDWRAPTGSTIDTPAPIALWGVEDPTPDWAGGASANAWVEAYGVNTSTLIRVGDQCTRFGRIELGGHPFIVGPTATPAEVPVLTRMLKAHPQIGAIFCVEPGTMHVREAAVGITDASGYRERPIDGYILSVMHGARGTRGSAAPQALASPVGLDGGLSHVQFMEFAGMERFDAQIPGEVLWRAGRGVAKFMRENPGKIALVCSERGIARPSAVAASAALQLRCGDARLRNDLATQVVAQRSEASDHHICVASRSFDLMAEFARLLDMLRSPGRGEPRWERKVHLLRQRLPELAAARGAGIDWQTDAGRRHAADVLEANFSRVAPLLASGGLPAGTALLWLRDEINVLSGVRFLSPVYVDGHIDRISQDDIDPDSPDALRLVSFDDYGLMCDNKYYDAASVAGWYRACLGQDGHLTNPISRAPVVALLVHETEKARLEPRFLHPLL